MATAETGSATQTTPAAPTSQVPIETMSSDQDKSAPLSDIGMLTDWKKVRIAGLAYVLSAIENTVVGMSEWPYMKEIDPEATTQFFGFVQSASKAGHAIFALLFAYWAFKTSSCRMPLLAGRYLALVGCVLYLFVEFLSSNRRYLMLLCYFIFGTGFSSATVLRGYVSAVTVLKDRSRGYAIITLSNLVSIVVGPIVQLLFSHLKYPGYEIIPGNLRFHIYSAPIWFALLTNVAAILVVQFMFEEAPPVAARKENTKSMMAKTVSVMRQKKIKWPLVVLCWGEKMVSYLSIATLVTITAPYFMLAYGWTGQKTVAIMSVAHIFIGVLSISIAALYIFCKLGQHVSARLSFMIGLILSLSLYLTTYPWPKVSTSFPAYNETEKTGCNSLEYDWCYTDGCMPPYVLILCTVLVMGVGIPFSIISIDTIYSKILGNIDQSVMQGAYVFVEDMFMVITPMYAASFFSKFGLTVLWWCNGTFTATALVIWIVCYQMLHKYK